MSQISDAAVAFAEQSKGFLRAYLQRDPALEEWIQFLTTAAGTLGGTGLVGTVRERGHDAAQSWVNNLISVIQLVARGAGTEIALKGGIEVIPVGSTREGVEPKKAKIDTACSCMLEPDGSCKSCVADLTRICDQFVEAIDMMNQIDTAKSAFCAPCLIKVIDPVGSEAIKRHEKTLLRGASAEMLLAMIVPQLKATPGMEIPLIEKALAELGQG